MLYPVGGQKKRNNMVATFTAHEERYDRTAEFVEILKGLWTEETFSYKGKFYEVENTNLFPKPVQTSKSNCMPVEKVKKENK